MNFYDGIKVIAKRKKIPMGHIEERAGLGKGCISKWNKVSPTMKNLEKVSDVLGISLTRLINECEKYTDDSV